MEDKRKKQAKDVDLVWLMEQYGHKVVVKSGRKVKFFSPFRSEGVPSFIVYTHNNTWYDWGNGESGDSIDLVRKIDGLSMGQSVSKLVDGGECKRFDSNASLESKVSGIEVLDFYPIENKTLLMYSASRCINEEALRSQCVEAEYVFTKTDHVFHYGIGFRNIKGGWELRSPTRKVGTSPKSWSFISGDDHSQCDVFEGFFDFLSFLTLLGQDKPTNDTYVLNSLVFCQWVVPELGNYEKWNLYLDNDQAADRYMKDHFSDSRADDKRVMYKNHKDCNEYLIWLCH